MIFSEPVWLLLLVPLCAGLYCWRRQTLRATIFYGMLVSLVVLALAEPHFSMKSRKGMVIAVVDRSLSMPTESTNTLTEQLQMLEKSKPDGWKFSVVTYGAESVVERMPEGSVFNGFYVAHNRHQSNLTAALKTAVSLVPEQENARFVIFSDGNWTGENPKLTVQRLAARGIAVDFRFSARSSVSDLVVQNISGPVSVYPGESFVVSSWIESPVKQMVRYQIKRNGKVISKGKKMMRIGRNRINWKERAGKAGTMAYELEVFPENEDKIKVNNKAKVLVGVKGHKPVLLVSDRPDAGLATLIRNSKIDLQVIKPERAIFTLERLSGYSCVILENIPAERLGQQGMENLAAWVEHHNGGLLMTGGRKSFGVGGYYKSPVEEVLPVSLELRQEHRKFSLGIVVALDRSGSMMARTPPGKTKMELAAIATAEVYDILSGQDEMGVIAIDSAPHDIIPIMPRSKMNSSHRSKILRMNSQGGGIYVYEALFASARMLMEHSKAGSQHILLFADAADAEQPGKYKELLKKCNAAGITVSVIGLGHDTDSDAWLLKDVAKLGGGQVYFTDKASELPRIFAQDTMVVARSTFNSEPVKVKVMPMMRGLMGETIPDFEIGGYNLCYKRAGANVAAKTTDDLAAPLLAYWQKGTGRVITYTGEVNGKYTGNFAGYGKAGELLVSMVRWASGEFSPLGNDMALVQKMEKGAQKVSLYLDPERAKEFFSKPPEITVLSSATGSKPVRKKLEFEWVDSDHLELSIPFAGDEVVLSTLHIPGQKSLTLAPACQPYSPEFNVDNDYGRSELNKFAVVSGGGELADLTSVWKKLPEKLNLKAMASWLILLAMICFSYDIFCRRTGFAFTKIWGFKLKTASNKAVAVEAQEEKATRKSRKKSVKTAKMASNKAVKEEKQVAEKKETKAVKKEEQGDSMMSALAMAKKRSRK